MWEVCIIYLGPRALCCWDSPQTTSIIFAQSSHFSSTEFFFLDAFQTQKTATFQFFVTFLALVPLDCAFKDTRETW